MESGKHKFTKYRTSYYKAIKKENLNEKKISKNMNMNYNGRDSHKKRFNLGTSHSIT